ncbi:slipin family protein [uncultured Sphaerochaeta sp.]|uniref:slipin family protein n=1 Tax=uncultured Sphaerochaeta sp. TaxID=886478 RepID=UPI002A0A16CF|nr:slipin family protein [uncultured Sphaerochaeta sp.]
MNIYRKKINRIMNSPAFTLKTDFRYGAVSFLLLALCMALGVWLQSVVFPYIAIKAILQFSLAIICSGLILAFFPMWATSIILIIFLWLYVLGSFGLALYPMAICASLGLLLSSSIQLIYQWDKVIVLRLGKFRKVHGSGLFFLIPIVDRIAESIDMRIRATDFSAEKTLTSDTVPVHVDALAFWMIWDAKKAVLEVEDYTEAVILSAQTALRDSIGKHELSSLLSEREELGKEIQTALDTKINPWGVSILSVEITDIIIPKELENSLSKQAQAEREKQSRVILGAAEVEIAKKFTEAAAVYANDPIALQLRSMNMIYEGIRENNSMMLIPASILDHMDMGSVLGTAALQKIQETKEQSNKKAEGVANDQR